FLARLVDRGLVDELEFLAVLLANAVGALVPAGLVEDLVRLVDVEFVFGRLGGKALRVVDEVRRGETGPAVDEFLDRILVDQQGKRLTNRRIAECRMPGLDARALAVNFGPRIGGVELKVLDRAAPVEHDPALAVLLEPEKD